jgi:mRNA interferase MazF
MTIKQGDVYWYSISKDRESRSIPHPHVVIQDTIINQSRIETLVVCGITTNMKKAYWPGNVLLNTNEANLSKRSIVDVSQIYVIKKNELGEYIGKLYPERVSQIFSGMKMIQDLQGQRG